MENLCETFSIKKLGSVETNDRNSKAVHGFAGVGPFPIIWIRNLAE